MKSGTYYSKNREKVLERERKKREKLTLEDLQKKKEYNKKYYLEKLKDKRGFKKSYYTKNTVKQPINNFEVKTGSFIISFD